MKKDGGDGAHSEAAADDGTIPIMHDGVQTRAESLASLLPE